MSYRLSSIHRLRHGLIRSRWKRWLLPASVRSLTLHQSSGCFFWASVDCPGVIGTLVDGFLGHVDYGLPGKNFVAECSAAKMAKIQHK